MKSKVLKELLFHRSPQKISVLIISFMATSFGLLAPFFQKGFIDLLSQTLTAIDPQSLLHLDLNLYQYIAGAVLLLFLSQVFFQLANFLGINEALLAQRRLAADLYRQVLELKKNAWQNLSVGEIISFYATDIPGATLVLEQTLPQGASVLFPLILSPIALLLFFQIPIWHTALMILVISLINIYLGLKQSRYFFLFKVLSSERMAIVNEWLQNIYFLKVLSLVSLFEKKIFEIREKETLNRFRMTRNGQVMNSISSTITFLINIMGLTSLIFFSNRSFSTGDLLAMTWILGVFLVKPFRQLPWLFTFGFDAWTSIQRLDQFHTLTEPPLTERPIPKPLQPMANLNPSADSVPPLLFKKEKKPLLDIQKMSLKIEKHEILKGLTFSIFPGEFIAIVGEVGSGKTSLLYSLIGETNPVFENYQIHQKSFFKLMPSELSQNFTLVPQEGFILSGTIKENITLEYQPDLPSKSHQDINLDSEVLKSMIVAEFQLDPQRFPLGLETRIGERGIDLSGGQKQRISLARAHYLKADIVLLDDCLSALDSHTERKITQNLLLSVWKDKTRILVTHRLDILPFVDRILFLQKGEIKAFDTYPQLLNNSLEFRHFMESMAEKKHLKQEVFQ